MNTNKITCIHCGTSITTNNINRHSGSQQCLINQDHQPKKSPKKVNRSGKNNPMYGKTAWNKGLTKETSEIVKQYSQTLRQRYADGMVDQSYKQTPEWKAKLRANAIAQGFGGYNERAGSSNGDYVYDSYGTKTYLQSSYEIQVYNELTSHGIRWARPSYFTWVDENNITRKYFPDFYLHDYDVYLDPKNSFLIIKDFIKIKSVRDQNNINVIVFNEHHLKWESLKLLIGGSIEN